MTLSPEQVENLVAGLVENHRLLAEIDAVGALLPYPLSRQVWDRKLQTQIQIDELLALGASAPGGA